MGRLIAGRIGYQLTKLLGKTWLLAKSFRSSVLYYEALKD